MEVRETEEEERMLESDSSAPLLLRGESCRLFGVDGDESMLSDPSTILLGDSGAGDGD